MKEEYRKDKVNKENNLPHMQKVTIYPISLFDYYVEDGYMNPDLYQIGFYTDFDRKIRVFKDLSILEQDEDYGKDFLEFLAEYLDGIQKEIDSIPAQTFNMDRYKQRFVNMIRFGQPDEFDYLTQDMMDRYVEFCGEINQETAILKQDRLKKKDMGNVNNEQKTEKENEEKIQQGID